MKSNFTPGLLGLFIALVLLPFVSFAQSLGDLLPPDSNLSLALVVVGGLYELTVRLFPTASDYSLFNKLGKVLNVIVPNRAKTVTGKKGIFQLVNFKKTK